MAQPEKGMKQDIKATKEEVKVAKEDIREIQDRMSMTDRDRAAVAREVRREIAERIVTVMTTALAVVAGLFWQTAINDTIKTFIPVSGAWQYEIGVALGVTVAAAVAIYILSKPATGKK
ncbi:MAG TPA: DUF5654 family protein [Candidatus Bilamarchaeum sp.]|nr:DUF5654 family protein [Candidatus Bilamarchaeum sp.]